MACQDSCAQQATQTKQRVILIECYFVAVTGTTVSKDSVVYQYSGQRGSRFKPYNFYLGGMYGYNSTFYPQWYPVADLPEPLEDVNSLDVLYDTYYDFNVTPQRTFPLSTEYMSAAYDTKGDLINHGHFYRRISHMSYQHKVVRNDNGQPTRIYSITVDTATSVTDTATVRKIHYDAQGRAISDTLYYEDTTSYHMAFQYSYDDKGHIIHMAQMTKAPRGPWQPYKDHVFHYNTLDLLDTRIETQFNNTSGKWEPYLKTMLTYNREGRLIALHNEPGANGTTRYDLHYNETGLADTFTRYFPNSYAEKTAYFYNSFGNPDSAHTYISSDTGRTFARRNKTMYHYELYEDTINAGSNGDIVLYPNPANNKLTIRWNGRKLKSAVNVWIYNSAGQRVKEIYIRKTAAENEIDISGLSSGIYYMSIVTEGGGKVHVAAIAVNNTGRP
jgi:hypothetical protein